MVGWCWECKCKVTVLEVEEMKKKNTVMSTMIKICIKNNRLEMGVVKSM